jgi:hypothetical protein
MLMYSIDSQPRVNIENKIGQVPTDTTSGPTSPPGAATGAATPTAGAATTSSSTSGWFPFKGFFLVWI